MTQKTEHDWNKPSVYDEKGDRITEDFNYKAGADYIEHKGKDYHSTANVTPCTIVKADPKALTVTLKIKSSTGFTVTKRTDAILDQNTKRHLGWYRIYMGPDSTYEMQHHPTAQLNNPLLL